MPEAAANIAERLQIVRKRVEDACQRCDRDPAGVQILAVSKAQPAAAIMAAAAHGQTCFGESYVQESIAKIGALAALDCEWHFIGPLQSNKTAVIASHFQWVHSIDRAKIARRLNDQRPAELPPLQLCLQVNISAETSKSGVSVTELPDLAAAVAELPRVKLRGIMAIPQRTADVAAQRAAFRKVRECLDDLNARGHNLDTLSMGMSNDLEAAIAEGSTLVRVGTAIFGPRPTRT